MEQRVEFDWRIAFAAWVALSLLVSLPTLSQGYVYVAGDDAMRLTGAIDLLSGQAYQDTTQYRDNVPIGAQMHWSRLIDLPVAALIAALTPLFAAGAPDAAAALWPLLLLFALVAVMLALNDNLVGLQGRIPLLCILALSIPLHTEFAPGRVDHHNVQMVLTILMVLVTINARTSAFAALLAGVVASTALAIGTEALPVVLVGLAVVPLFWVFGSPRGGRHTMLFAVSFAGSAVVHLGLATPPESYLEAACDALSITYVTAGLLYAAAVAAAVALCPWLRHWSKRLLVLAGFGIVAAVGWAFLFPACLGGPYGDLDPDVAQALLTPIGEAQPVWIWIRSAPPFGIAAVVLPFIGLATLFAAIMRHRDGARIDWIVLTAFAFTLLMVMVVQVRVVRIAVLPSLIAGAWLISLLWERLRVRQTIQSALPVLLAALVFSGAAQYAVARALTLPQAIGQETARGAIDPLACAQAPSYAQLATLPSGRVVSYLLLAPQILKNTAHAVVTAGYHRNEAGLRDQVRFFSGDEAEALAVARERELDYFVYCRSVPASGGLFGVAPFTPRGADEAGWSWLRRLSTPDEPVQVYAIDLPA